MLDPEAIRKTHPRLILAFNKAVGLGLDFFFSKIKGLRIRGHNGF